MTARNRLLIAAACFASLGAAGWIASGDAPERVRGNDMGNPITAKAPKPTTRQPAASSTMQAGAFDPFCVKCGGAMSAPLTYDEIGQAGDAAQITVLGIRENGMLRAVDLSSEPPWRSHEIGAVPLPVMPGDTRPAWPIDTPRDTPWIYLPASPGPIPESSAWAMLLIGFGATGFTLRKRQQQ